MHRVITLALACIGLTPAVAADWETVGNWKITYGATYCDARTTINNTELVYQYDWTDDSMAVGLSNPDWTLPAEPVTVTFALLKKDGEIGESYTGDLRTML